MGTDGVELRIMRGAVAGTDALYQGQIVGPVDVNGFFIR